MPDRNHRHTSLKLPTRAEIDAPATRTLKAGGPTKADLLLVGMEAEPVVVKDFARKRAWVRLAGRLQVSRECRAFRRVGAAPGLVGFVGRVDSHALALERVEGEPLAQGARHRDDRAALWRRLSVIVNGFHASGLAHLDLGGRDNVLLGKDGNVVVLDLASAVWMRPGGWAYRYVFPLLRRTDEAALLKWKRLLDAGPYTPQEEAFLARHRFWRGLWPFNRKRPPRATPGAR